jgi:hypothetical protein
VTARVNCGSGSRFGRSAEAVIEQGSENIKGENGEAEIRKEEGGRKN